MTGPACTHLDQANDVTPSGDGCVECLETGDRWVHLRLCMTCGHVGCCDSSPNKHATAHFHSDGHPLVQVTINGHGPYTFVLDTGASALVVSQWLVDELKLPTRKAPANARIFTATDHLRSERSATIIARSAPSHARPQCGP